MQGSWQFAVGSGSWQPVGSTRYPIPDTLYQQFNSLQIIVHPINQRYQRSPHRSSSPTFGRAQHQRGPL